MVAPMPWAPRAPSNADPAAVRSPQGPADIARHIIDNHLTQETRVINASDEAAGVICVAQPDEHRRRRRVGVCGGGGWLYTGPRYPYGRPEALRRELLHGVQRRQLRHHAGESFTISTRPRSEDDLLLG